MNQYVKITKSGDDYTVKPNAGIELNKSVEIDVSSYTEPVVVNPTSPNEAMEATTVSLTNIPAGANMLYAWYDGENTYYFDFDIAPSSKEDFFSAQSIDVSYSRVLNVVGTEEVFNINYDYQKTDDTHFSAVTVNGATVTVTRDTTKDVEIWNAPPEVETTKQAIIDVSTYDPSNKPVITPTAGKQSMGSVEVTLDNIPSPSGDTYTTHNSPDRSGIFCYVLGEVRVGGMAVCNNEGSFDFEDFTCENITDVSGSVFQTSGGGYWNV